MVKILCAVLVLVAGVAINAQNYGNYRATLPKRIQDGR